MTRINITTTFLAIMLAGCDISPQYAQVMETSESSPPASIATKGIEVLDDMVFIKEKSPTKVIRFQRGIYTAKTDDRFYIYYESTMPIERGTFTPDGKNSELSFNQGGIMIAKNTPETGPACGYVIESDGTKRVVWNLDKEFLDMEGAEWRYTNPSANQALE